MTGGTTPAESKGVSTILDLFVPEPAVHDCRFSAQTKEEQGLDSGREI